uniref:Uncharacterized protein n=1 Tax=Arundo donax TaxID=35708 RepID=A0A0A9BBT5_ARUDO
MYLTCKVSPKLLSLIKEI